MSPPRRQALRFTVIGGYLGAGKTTLVNHLLANTTGLRIAVLVNDFGSVNIDASLIRSREGDTFTLANGCMCCSLVGGFASAVDEIRRRAAEFDHVVIEASGVADPAKIAEYGKAYGLSLDGTLVLADAEQVRAQAENKYVGDTVRRQLAQADLIVLNKTDLVSPEERLRVRTWLGELAPGAPMVEARRGEAPADILLGPHEGRSSESSMAADSPAVHPHAAYATWTVERTEPIARDAVVRFSEGLGPDIYRAKGFVDLADDPGRRYVYQRVGSRWSLQPENSWSDGRRATLLVIIGRPGASNAAALGALLDASAAGTGVRARHHEGARRQP